MHLIDVSIPQAKLKKLAEGKTVTIKCHELNGTTQKLHVHPETYKKILKARKNNKGIRLTISKPEIMHDIDTLQGGSIWSSIWDVVKKNVLPVLADAGFGALGSYAGQPELAAAARGGFKNLTGIGMKKRTGRLVKGSQEAKDYMASIRAKKSSTKKNMNGGSFKLS